MAIGFPALVLSISAYPFPCIIADCINMSLNKNAFDSVFGIRSSSVDIGVLSKLFLLSFISQGSFASWVEMYVTPLKKAATCIADSGETIVPPELVKTLRGDSICSFSDFCLENIFNRFTFLPLYFFRS